jgi:hypothetical protein
MTVTLKFAIVAGILLLGVFAFKLAAARAAQSGPEETPDLVIESVYLDPPNGSTLREQTPIHATIRFRFTKPGAEIGAGNWLGLTPI